MLSNCDGEIAGDSADNRAASYSTINQYVYERKMCYGCWLRGIRKEHYNLHNFHELYGHSCTSEFTITVIRVANVAFVPSAAADALATQSLRAYTLLLPTRL